MTCPEEKISAEAEAISEAFISTLPEIRGLLATDVEATFNGDPAAQNLGEVIFCYPGFRATVITGSPINCISSGFLIFLV